MRAPKQVIEQAAQISQEVKSEKDAVAKMFNVFGEQTEEYKSAAKSLNQKLRAAGLDALCMVEK